MTFAILLPGKAPVAHTFSKGFSVLNMSLSNLKCTISTKNVKMPQAKAPKTNSRTLKTGEAQRYDLHFLVFPVKRPKIVTLECSEEIFLTRANATILWGWAEGGLEGGLQAPLEGGLNSRTLEGGLEGQAEAGAAGGGGGSEGSKASRGA